MNWHIFDTSVFSFLLQYINTLAELKKPKSIWIILNIRAAHTHFHTHYSPSLHTCTRNTDTPSETHTICTWEYHESLLTKTVLQIDSHGQREHLELISLLCSDKSFGADFRLTIQTLLMHRKHICLLPHPVVNNQQVRWGCVLFSSSSSYFNSLFC